MGSERHVCPACGQPVETVVRRHKTLGTWVPLWVAGPCRNPECGAYDAEGAVRGDTGEDTRPLKGDRSLKGDRFQEGDGSPGDDRPTEVTAPPAESPPEPASGESAAEKP
ncbi:hypothetical protein ACIQNT_20275 [Streptomyces luteogriseus]|uniref:hypothetical protein n=1 Tax=Streptomyces luteogriseus TaxID=68233 RepID=UPI0037F48FD2